VSRQDLLKAEEEKQVALRLSREAQSLLRAELLCCTEASSRAGEQTSDASVFGSALSVARWDRGAVPSRHSHVSRLAC